MHVARRGLQIGRKPLVVFDVAGAAQFRKIVLAFEFTEQIVRRLAEQIDEHVEAAPVRHAEDGLFDARLAALLHHVIEQRDQAIAALQREALLPDILAAQVSFQPFGRGHLPEDILFLINRKFSSDLRGLEVVLQPPALLRVRDMRKLGADRVHVNLRQRRENRAQRGAFGEFGRATASKELPLHVGVRQAEIRRLQYVPLGHLLHAQRIELGVQVAAIRIDLNEARDRTLLRAGLIGGGTVAAARAGPLGGARRHLIADRPMRHFTFGACREGGEVRSPGALDGGRVAQELFV